jgi:hypothetical protein
VPDQLDALLERDHETSHPLVGHGQWPFVPNGKKKRKIQV